MRIGLTGTMSVGKTTLINELSKDPYFKNYKFFTERTQYLKSYNIPTDKQSTILGQYTFLGERSAELVNDNFITDRSMFDVLAFTLTSPHITEEDKQQFKDVVFNLVKDYDYIFYIDPIGTKIEDNGIRDTNEEFRNLINETIYNNIIDYINIYGEWMGPEIIKISGSTENRIKQIKKVLNKRELKNKLNNG